MKFFALLLAFVCVVTSAEANETFESSEIALKSKRCKFIKKRFYKRMSKIDTNRNGKMTWNERSKFLTKYAKKHHKSMGWIRKSRLKVYRRWR